MTEPRADRLLAELRQRYDLDPAFVAKLRPSVIAIFSPEIPEERRTELLELLAETCERNVRIREGNVKLKEALQRLLATLIILRDRLGGTGEASA